MELSAYEIALISGGFGIVGALLGVVISHRLALRVATVQFEDAIRLNRIAAIREAGNNLRFVFAQQLAAIKVDQNQSAVDIQRRLESTVDMLTGEMENFRFYVAPENLPAYDEACQEYRAIAHIRAMNYFAGFDGREPLKVFEEKVHAVLRFAKP